MSKRDSDCMFRIAMSREDETREDSRRSPTTSVPREPGIVIVFAAGRPAGNGLRAGEDPLEIGRGTPPGVLEDDDRMSRRHARIEWQKNGWRIEDLGSRNGTFVDGRKLSEAGVFPSSSLIRVGRSLIWLVDDVSPFLDARISLVGGAPIVGGRLRSAWAEIALASRSGETLCLLGESGSGKEIAARAFHDARHGAAKRAPFVGVNCAAIPEGLAERLLFGTTKGAYSGAVADAEGYVVAAHGGTLFLDEIAELDAAVQAKLLRVLESREVLPLGAARPRRVEIAVCVASHKDLREEVSAGRFRQDLYFRVGQPEVRILPLRERLDEIPWLIASELLAVDKRLSASVALVESCALLTWPGNIRELLGEIRRAGQRAVEQGSVTVRPEHLSRQAGIALATPGTQPPAKRALSELSDEEIVRSLEQHGGNVRATARALGIHRNQIRRWLAKRAARLEHGNGSAVPPAD